MFATEDITLVATLKLRGLEPERLEKNNGGCRWCFERTQALDEIVHEYSSDEGTRVDPREFNKKLGLVRKAMYSFLQVNPTRVRKVHQA